MASPHINPAAALAHRMERHHLLERAPADDLMAVAGRLCGLHAQVMSCAELAAWIRVEGTGSQAVKRALWDDRSLVKTWHVRGTLHLVPAQDHNLFKTALLGRNATNAALWLKLNHLTIADLDRIGEAVVRTLQGRCLTRKELAVELDLPRLASGWGELLKPITSRGLICCGPPRGQEVTFVRVDEWLGAQPAWEPGAARQELLRRYLGLNGPARLPDFAYWAGAAPAWARPIWASLEDELVEVSVDGRSAWVLAEDLDELGRAEPVGSVRLLGGFDAYVLGHQDRSHVLEPAFKHLVSRTSGWISAVLLVGGRVEGTWTHRLVRDRFQMTVAPFGRLDTRVRREIEAELAGLADFFGRPCDLIVA